MGWNKLRRSRTGLTLVELIIAIFMATIVLSSAFGLYITQHNQLLVQEDVSEIQGNARAVAELLAGEIRKAGYLLPSIVTSIETSDTNPDTITVKFATSKLVGVELSQDMTSETADLVCTGSDLSELAADDWVYIYDSTAATGEVFQVSSVDVPSGTISHSSDPLSRTYPLGCRLNTVMSDKFYVDSSDDSNPKLMIQRLGEQAEIYADNIQSLNFIFYMADGSETTTLVNPAEVRMIGIDVTAKSERSELNSFNGSYRSRKHFLKVSLRNFGLS